MPLARIVQRPTEAKNYTLGYEDWLQEGDQITSVSATVDPVTTPALSVNASVATGNTSVVMAVSAGLASNFYAVRVQVFIDSGPEQIKEDCVEVDIEDYC